MRDHRYMIGEEVCGFIILEQTRIKRNTKNGTEKGYKVKCCKCGVEDYVFETKLNGNKGCVVCYNRKVIKGINDLATTHPEYIPYFKNKDDACKYTYKSNKTIDGVCPECGFEKRIKINNLTRGSFGCNRCSDGVSYGEKFITSLFEQLSIPYEYQYSPNWAENKRYDFYIQNCNCIVEVNGIQHYSYSGFKNSVEEVKKLDDYKKQLALDNGITNYVVLDFTKTTKKDSVVTISNSELSKLITIDSSRLDWNICHHDACSSMVFKAVELWNNGTTNTQSIANSLNIDSSTVVIYLKMANELGICDYDAKKIRSDCGRVSGEAKAKTVLDVNNNIIFNSCVEVENKSIELYGVKLLKQGVAKVCRGERPHYKGYVFKYM